MLRKVILPIILCLMLLMSSCDSRKMAKYYANKDNYIEVTGSVNFINRDQNGLYYGFEDMSVNLSDDCFKITGKNKTIVNDMGIDQKIHIGDTVTFITAPRYFGDGYVMPIVAISIDGESLLCFDEGLANLQEEYQ